jgi:hypothetical protein
VREVSLRSLGSLWELGVQDRAARERDITHLNSLTQSCAVSSTGSSFLEDERPRERGISFGASVKCCIAMPELGTSPKDVLEAIRGAETK